MHIPTPLFLILLGAALVVSPVPASAGPCPPTQEMSSGTHFKPITRARTDIGEGLQVQGRILAAPDCTPVTGARIEHWQAGREGFYTDRLRAYLESDAGGRYRFNTEWPAAYIPHIHFRVSADGYRTLTTQWVGSDVVDSITFDIVLVPESGR